MPGKYLCVHCGRERGNGCGCVSPFADNAVLAAMRDDVAQENAMKSVIAMMQRMTDNIFAFGDSLRDSGQNVPGITDWLPGHNRIPRPDMVFINPLDREKFEPYDIPVTEWHHVPKGTAYLVEDDVFNLTARLDYRFGFNKAGYPVSEYENFKIECDPGKRCDPPDGESEGE